MTNQTEIQNRLVAISAMEGAGVRLCAERQDGTWSFQGVKIYADANMSTIAKEIGLAEEFAPLIAEQKETIKRLL